MDRLRRGRAHAAVNGKGLVQRHVPRADGRHTSVSGTVRIQRIAPLVDGGAGHGPFVSRSTDQESLSGVLLAAYRTVFGVSSRPACSAARRSMVSTSPRVAESGPRAARAAAMAPAWMKSSAVGAGRVGSSTGRSPPAVQAVRSGAMGASPCNLASGAGVEESTACTWVQRVLAGMTASDSIRAQAAERAVRASVLSAVEVAVGIAVGVAVGGRGGALTAGRRARSPSPPTGERAGVRGPAVPNRQVRHRGVLAV